MRKLWITACALLCTSLAFDASAADDLWMQSDKSLPTLVAEGYAIVGFNVIPNFRGVMTLTLFRYILQKDVSVFMCTETDNGGRSSSTACLELVAP